MLDRTRGKQKKKRNCINSVLCIRLNSDILSTGQAERAMLKSKHRSYEYKEKPSKALAYSLRHITTTHVIGHPPWAVTLPCSRGFHAPGRVTQGKQILDEGPEVEQLTRPPMRSNILGTRCPLPRCGSPGPPPGARPGRGAQQRGPGGWACTHGARPGKEATWVHFSTGSPPVGGAKGVGCTVSWATDETWFI